MPAHAGTQHEYLPNMLSAHTVNVLIVLPPLLGLLWAGWSWFSVGKVQIDGHPELLTVQDSRAIRQARDIAEQMSKIAASISAGVSSFLITEYAYMALHVALIAVILLYLIGTVTTVAFVLGSLAAVLSVWVGMQIATFTNVRTTHQCWKDLRTGFDTAIQGGSVTGLSAVSIGVLAIYGLVLICKLFFHLKVDEEMFTSVAGFALGAAFMSLFGRVGGGMYTKGTSIGAELSAKNDYGLQEDDCRNPACIADKVGDHVGGVAGAGHDLFSSLAGATCAALLLASASELRHHYCSVMLPVLLSSTGIFIGILTLWLQGVVYKVKDVPDVEMALKGLLVMGAVIMSFVAVALCYFCLPSEFAMEMDHTHVKWWYCSVAILLGLWSGVAIGFVTEYYTSHGYTPVREISETQRQSAATGVIYGLAVGYLSVVVPVVLLGVTVLFSHSLCGMFGVSLAALGMLATLSVEITLGTYGAIAKNAGGIAQMSSMPEAMQGVTDSLDAAGSDLMAMGKGFATATAFLVSLALFGAFSMEAGLGGVDILDPWTFTGLLLGAMMPYAFAAWTMKSITVVANDTVKECLTQFPRIMGAERAEADYGRCVRVATDTSLREMVAPGALVVLGPLVAGLGFGRNACAGLLIGEILSGLVLALSMSNSGSAWDSSKKYVSAGGVGREFVKGSEAHKNAVTGDRVGDPLKDSAGPALNVLMQLSTAVSLVFAGAIASYSNEQGGPCWLG